MVDAQSQSCKNNGQDGEHEEGCIDDEHDQEPEQGGPDLRDPQMAPDIHVVACKEENDRPAEKEDQALDPHLPAGRELVQGKGQAQPDEKDVGEESSQDVERVAAAEAGQQVGMFPGSRVSCIAVGGDAVVDGRVGPAGIEVPQKALQVGILF